MKLPKLALIVITTVILITVSCCPSATATPAGTVNAYLDAIVARNAQTIVSYETDSFKSGTTAQRIEELETFFGELKSYSITNRNLVVESEDATTVTVSASFDFSLIYIDDTTSEDATATVFTLIRVGGKWLISATT